MKNLISAPYNETNQLQITINLTRRCTISEKKRRRQQQYFYECIGDRWCGEQQQRDSDSATYSLPLSDGGLVPECQQSPGAGVAFGYLCLL